MTETGTGAGPGRPAGVDSGDTRQRVIDAACRCFAQHGYGPTTNQLIAKMAGVTAGSLHYHFGTKGNLFGAVCADVYGKILPRATRVIAGPHTVPGLLRAWLTESMRINHEVPELAGFVAAAPIDASRHPELSGALSNQTDQVIEILALAVQEGQQGGLIPADRDPVQVAGLIAAIIDGFARAATEADPGSMDATTDLFRSLLLDAADGAAHPNSAAK